MNGCERIQENVVMRIENVVDGKVIGERGGFDGVFRFY